MDHIEDGDKARVTKGSKIQSESTQAALGAQPTLPTDSDVNIPSAGENYERSTGDNCEGDGAINNEDVGHIDNSLLKSFKFHRARRSRTFVFTISRQRGILQGTTNGLRFETNSFYFKWGEMTPTLDDVEQLIGFGIDGDATIIGKIWGFLVLFEVFLKNLLLDLNGYTNLKAGGAGNSLRKIREHYAYKLEKVLSEGTAARTKKKELVARFIAHVYILYVLGSFLFPVKKGTDVSAQYLDMFAKDKATMKWLYETRIEIKGIQHMGSRRSPISMRKKLVNAEEMKKSLEVNNNEWVLASEGMGDMGRPTFEELFNQNERFFTISHQGPKGDYQEDLVSMGLTLENVIIARRDNMAKKKKLEEVLFQPWMKYLLDVRSVDISDNNSTFRILAMV
ncbi:hypothetical protein GIB67_034330 [Kingdonia uniflora]|uniref:Aminotransferase-like plant mobile domain-containing protein n=1 Tax=Kingdonia uniflora TaxID=39325 RepID=A0A7J7NSN6_9MAGN|nr:hypothetical protein GIB67_034330 [Kingdonia uniflora]